MNRLCSLQVQYTFRIATSCSHLLKKILFISWVWMPDWSSYLLLRDCIFKLSSHLDSSLWVPDLVHGRVNSVKHITSLKKSIFSSNFVSRDWMGDSEFYDWISAMSSLMPCLIRQSGPGKNITICSPNIQISLVLVTPSFLKHRC